MPEDVKWPFPPKGKVSWWYYAKNRTTIAAVGTLSKIWIEWVNRTTVHNRGRLYDAIEKRSEGQPLITVSNHTSCIDDPILWGNLKFRHMRWMRWIPTAADICFTKSWHSAFFSLGQCVPVLRGAGVYQRGMDFLIEKLNSGEWVHVFVEGKVNEKHEFIRLKWGVGRLIDECSVMPIVLPLWHIGMDSVLPNTKPYIPRIGKNVTLLVGEPIELEAMLHTLREANKTPMEIRKALTDKIQEEFYAMKVKAEKIHHSQSEDVS